MNLTASPKNQAIGSAYAEYRQVQDELIDELGGDDFARFATLTRVREVFGAIRSARPGFGYRAGLFVAYAEPLTASQATLEQVISNLRRSMTPLDVPASYEGSLVHEAIAGGKPARITLRDRLVHFECGKARVLLAHAYPENLSRFRANADTDADADAQKWMVATTNEFEAMLVCMSRDKPKVSLVHVKSFDAAIKSLLRSVKTYLGVDLRALSATSAPAESAA